MKKTLFYLMLFILLSGLVAQDVSIKVKTIEDGVNLKTRDMDFMNLLILIGIVLIVFFLLRELWTWYWKINMLVANQNITQDLLKDILAELKKQSPNETID